MLTRPSRWCLRLFDPARFPNFFAWVGKRPTLGTCLVGAVCGFARPETVLPPVACCGEGAEPEPNSSNFLLPLQKAVTACRSNRGFPPSFNRVVARSARLLVAPPGFLLSRWKIAWCRA